MHTCSMNKALASHAPLLPFSLPFPWKCHTALEKPQSSSRTLTKPLKRKASHLSFLQSWQGQGQHFLL